MADNRYTDRQKVEVALRKGLWDIFIKALPKVSKAELNQVNKRGETLVEIALGTQRHDFLKALFDAGATPFVGANGVSYTEYRYADSESVEIITEARNLIYSRAADLCYKSDLEAIISFIDENGLIPTANVCGGRNLFVHTFMFRTVDEKTISTFMLKYLDRSRLDYHDNLQALMFSAYLLGTDDFWTKMQGYAQRYDFKFQGEMFQNLMEYVPLKKMLETYIARKPITAKRLLRKIQYVMRLRLASLSQSEEIVQQKVLIDSIQFDQNSEFAPFEDYVPPKNPFKIADKNEPPPPPGIPQNRFADTVPGDPSLEDLLKK
jgi:hypothetical protein